MRDGVRSEDGRVRLCTVVYADGPAMRWEALRMSLRSARELQSPGFELGR